MNIFEFIASLVKSLVSLAWPAALVASVWLFRDKINELLPLVRMRYKDFDISFRLDQAEEEAAALPPPPPGEEISEPTEEEKSRFEEIAERSPRAAILEARADVEEALRQLAHRADVSKAGMQSFLRLTRELRSHGKIGSETAALLDDLRALGNAAAHRGDVVLTKEEALRYRSLADQAIVRLQLEELL